eukprot:1892976-Rhodomonas_salina.4
MAPFTPLRKHCPLSRSHTTKISAHVMGYFTAICLLTIAISSSSSAPLLVKQPAQPAFLLSTNSDPLPRSTQHASGFAWTGPPAFSSRLALRGECCLCKHELGARKPLLLDRRGVRPLTMSAGDSKLVPRDIITKEVVEKAKEVQAWLEDLYDSVDYEAALIRAGVMSEGEDMQDDDDVDDVLEEEEAASDEETGEQCEGMEGELTYGVSPSSFAAVILTPTTFF